MQWTRATCRGTKEPPIESIAWENIRLSPGVSWLFLLLVIRLTISHATSAKSVNGLWTRRFIAMVLIDREIYCRGIILQSNNFIIFFYPCVAVPSLSSRTRNYMPHSLSLSARLLLFYFITVLWSIYSYKNFFTHTGAKCFINYCPWSRWKPFEYPKLTLETFFPLSHVTHCVSHLIVLNSDSSITMA